MNNYEPTSEEIKLYITNCDPVQLMIETIPFAPIPFSQDEKKYYIVQQLQVERNTIAIINGSLGTPCR